MSHKIYMIEDETSLRVLLEKYLQNEGYEVVSFANGTSAIDRISDSPDLWLLDITLPDISGYEIIKLIKEHDSSTPVVFMSARSEELDRVVGLELGSEDYLSKPFLPRELIIRVNRVLQRVYGGGGRNVGARRVEETKSDILMVSGYIICETGRSVAFGNDEINLTNNEFDLLVHLINNQNNTLSRKQILEKIWGDTYFGSIRVVDDTIRRLRKKMRNMKLDTIYGYGYKLVVRS